MSPVLAGAVPRWDVVLLDESVPPKVKHVTVVASSAGAAQMRADQREREQGRSFRSVSANEVAS